MRMAKGFSLVEVLIASAILAVGLMGLASMFPTAYTNVDRSGDQTVGVTLAEQQLELLRNRSYIALAAGTTTETAIPGYAGYTRTTTIQNDIPTTGVKQVMVTVATPAGRNVQTMSLIAR